MGDRGATGRGASPSGRDGSPVPEHEDAVRALVRDALVVRLDAPYGLLIDSDVPDVVQFSRQDTRQRENARMLATAWAD